uniref:Uncharacterized protein n=1 Tax=Pelusios castaneus TaxID=367368 RepID=A0A8C8SBN5_9SAUR
DEILHFVIKLSNFAYVPLGVIYNFGFQTSPRLGKREPWLPGRRELWVPERRVPRLPWRREPWLRGELWLSREKGAAVPGRKELWLPWRSDP